MPQISVSKKYEKHLKITQKNVSLQTRIRVGFLYKSLTCKVLYIYQVIKK